MEKRRLHTADITMRHVTYNNHNYRLTRHLVKPPGQPSLVHFYVHVWKETGCPIHSDCAGDWVLVHTWEDNPV